MYWQKWQPFYKKKHALKNDSKRFVSVFSVEDILEQEKENNIAFIWKFQTNFALFLALLMRNKFVYQVQQERNLSTWDILQRGKYFVIIHS